MDFWTAQLSALRHEAPVVPAPEMTGRRYSEDISETWMMRRRLKAARDGRKPRGSDRRPRIMRPKSEIPREWPPVKYADDRPAITGKEFRLMRLFRHISICELAEKCWPIAGSARTWISSFEKGANDRKINRDCLARAMAVLEEAQPFAEPAAPMKVIRESDRLSREKVSELYETRIRLGLPIERVKWLGKFSETTIRKIERGELVKPATVKRLEDFYKQYERRNI